MHRALITGALILTGALLVSGCMAPPQNESTPVTINSDTLNDSELAALGIERPAPETARPALAVAPDGLSLSDMATGVARPIAFGTPRAATMAAVHAALGTIAEEGEQAECGPGPLGFARWPGGLSLSFQGGKFVGWSATSGGNAKIATAAGIGIGSTRDELVAALSPEIAQSSLGTEFTAGTLSGLLEGSRHDAKITDMWAGLTCIAR